MIFSAELSRLRNSLEHLDRTQYALKEYLDGENEQDQELITAFEENKHVMLDIHLDCRLFLLFTADHQGFTERTYANAQHGTHWERP